MFFQAKSSAAAVGLVRRDGGWVDAEHHKATDASSGLHHQLLDDDGGAAVIV